MRGNEVKIEGFIGKTIKTNDDKTYVSFSLSVKKQDKAVHNTAEFQEVVNIFMR